MKKVSLTWLTQPRFFEVVNGKREPSKLQARNLGEFFGVPPELFLSLD